MRGARRGDPAGAAPPLVQLREVHHSFGTVVALQGAGLTLRAGEVHAVLGENGAGKTTLLRVLAGLHPPDRGDLLIESRPVRFRTPRDAWRAGIGLVHQHFTLVPRLSVLENLALGARRPRPVRVTANAVAGPTGSDPERTWGGWRSGLRSRLAGVRDRAAALATTTGLSVPVQARVEALGVGDRQRVEILKVLLRDPRVLALDEPTAVLAPAETLRLHALLRQLAGAGRAIVIVAHKLDEVLAVADRVTVLRDGRTVLESPRADVDARALARAMLGEAEARAQPAALREVLAAGADTGTSRAPAAAQTPPDQVARLDRVVLATSTGEAALRGVSLEVHRGEIVGVAGVEGNGQRELALMLAGREPPSGGFAVLPPDPGFIPQDRSREGLIAAFDLVENMALALHRQPRWRRGATLRWTELRVATAELLARHRVRAAGVTARAGTLSGGNQQRVVVARELEAGRDLLIAENPTRGLDLSATAFVHEELLRLRAEGRIGIVLLSTDLDEVLALADRLFVMVRGRLREVTDSAPTRATVGALMLSVDGPEGHGRA